MKYAFGFIALSILVLNACNSEQPCPDRTMYNNLPCPEDTNWVCGCDDSTYVNECRANNAGIWIQYTGECTE